MTAFTDTSGTVTFAAMTGQVLSEVTAELYNKRGHGFRRAEYTRALNKAIDDASGLGLIEVFDSTGGTFDADSPEITLDVQFQEIYKVEYTDADGFFHEVKKAPRWGGEGWTGLTGQGKIRIEGQPGQLADGRTLQIWGYGRQASLSADSDTCALDTTWLIARAKYRLADANGDRRPDLAGKLMLYRADAKDLEARLRKLRHADAMRVW